MKNIFRITALCGVLSLSSCGGHFMTHPGYRSQVSSDFAARMEALGYRPQNDTSDCPEMVGSVFSTLECAQSVEEREALTFLYAYMPLGDMADYDGRLWLQGVRTALAAREEMPWGRDIPEDIFRHFVLPLRVNNENLDSARTVFYGELKDRVRGLGMHGAILEVNHWCHEKVTYSPSDARTSAPLATMKTAWGRCGEESVFCVTALRAVGIPARQVYTPRWAHTDDNHAWVEVWADGQWHYIGACEPEPRLDVAWFSTTVKRGLLMHTKAFGRYEDDDADIIDRTACYTELNVTANYVPVSRVKVRVVDVEGRPVRGAKTEFRIYNYAEFYPAITTVTDEDGLAGATFGHGDILVWASDGERYGYARATPGADGDGGTPGLLQSLLFRRNRSEHGTVRVTLDRKEGEPFEDDIDIVPPAAVPVSNPVTEGEAEANKVRLACEDSLRREYTSTFPEGDIYTVAAFGNWEEVESFIFFNSSTPERRATAERMLDLLNDKDLRDTPCDILMDHVTGFYLWCDPSSPQADFLLNPRVANEMLTPYRSGLRARYGDSLTVERILDLAGSIKVMDEQNPARIPVSPLGVARAGAADTRSRDIFFVSLCRTYGIPSRLDPVDSDPQYWAGGLWHDADFLAASSGSLVPTGRLLLTYDGAGTFEDPKYEIHFTLSRMEGGIPVLLNFTDSEHLEGSATWKNTFRQGVSLESGCYMLTTGTRMASGRVLSTVTVFDVPDGGSVSVPLILRQDDSELKVLGSMDAESVITLLEPSGDGSVNERDASILATTGRGYFVLCFAVPGSEPCNHSMQSLLREEPPFPAIIIFCSRRDYDGVDWNTFPPAPDRVHFAWSAGLLDDICRELKITEPEMPVSVIADTFGRIVYVSRGYNIGLAEQLKKL